MKIYEVGTGYTPIPAKMGAATEIVVEELTKSLKKQKLDVKIIDIKASNRTENELPIIEVPVPEMFTGTDVKLGVMHKLKRVVYSISLAIVLGKLIKRSKEKVVIHFHNQYNMYFFLKIVPRKVRKRCFIIYTNHSYIWHGDWTEIERTVKKRYFQEIESMKKADLVYVLNDIAREHIIKHIGISEKKIKLIDNGVNTDVYKPLLKEEIDSFKVECGLTGKKVFIQIGSVCDRKNQLGAVNLLMPFLKANPNMIFLYAGGIISTEYQESIQKYAEEQGVEKQVRYIGELKPGENLNKYYNLADAMIFPSKSEGFSLVIIEAMAAGVPVFINRELKFKLADSCLQYSSNEEFIKIFEEQILDDINRVNLSNKVREVTVNNYSWDKIARDYVDALK